ncbi:Agrocin 84 efflux transporter (plasmid) [Rhizobium rhizogenes K84]|uniref:Agrocin 84 efflux transporter n=3 Tax=Rhizobium/Agrobacterium group TaxID=227290 RepID=B9JQS0_RHIR8|nr:probable polysaccharide efflux transporter [Agrobacterium radiobacter]ACM31478.1 Agrocin 84 efflux transporter [Rhizobium rhizogenes K84]
MARRVPGRPIADPHTGSSPASKRICLALVDSDLCGWQAEFDLQPLAANQREKCMAAIVSVLKAARQDLSLYARSRNRSPSLWLTGTTMICFVSTGSMYFLAPILSTYIDSKSLSKFLYILSIMNLITPLCLIGLDTALLKLDNAGTALASAWRHAVFAICVSGVAGAILDSAIMDQGNDKPIMPILSIIMALICILRLITSILKLEGRTEQAVVTGSIIPAALLVLLSYRWQADIKSAAELFYIYAAAFALCITYGSLILVSRSINFKSVAQKIGRQQLVYFGFFSVSLVANESIDRVVLGTFGNVDDVARFAVISAIANLSLLGHVCISQIFPPVIAQMFRRGDYRSLQSVLFASSAFGTTIFVVSAASSFVFAPSLEGLFGWSKLEWLTFGVLMVGNFINVSTGLCGFLLNMTGLERFALCINIISVAINTTVSIILVPAFGVLGVAIATTSAIIIANILMLITSVIKHRLVSGVLFVFAGYGFLSTSSSSNSK